nr:hypothetical protein [Tengunoibacter tsumagoiensis]
MSDDSTACVAWPHWYAVTLADISDQPKARQLLRHCERCRIVWRRVNVLDTNCAQIEIDGWQPWCMTRLDAAIRRRAITLADTLNDLAI